MNWPIFSILLAALTFTAITAVQAQTGVKSIATNNQRRFWKPEADEIYLQESGEKIVTQQPVTAIALQGKTAYLVVGGEIKVLQSFALAEVPGAPKGVRRLRSFQNTLWASSDKGVFRLKESSSASAWEQVSTESFVDFCEHLGSPYAATRNDLFRLENNHFVNVKPASGYLSSDSTLIMEDSSQVLADPVEIGPIQRITSYSGTLYLLRHGRLALLEGKTLVTGPIDWGMMPSSTTRDMLSQGSRLYVATDHGVAVLRGMAMTVLRGTDGLPFEDTTCLADGFDGDLWVGTTRGVIRKTGSEYHFFGAHHWLPADNVLDIAVGEHTA